MRRNRSKNTNGSSLLEMLVALAITGIAIAGLSSVLFINGLFSIRQFNKVDNIMGANHFFEMIGRDLRRSIGIGSAIPTAAGVSGSYDVFNGVQMDNDTLILQLPHLETPSTVSSPQFPAAETPSGQKPTPSVPVSLLDTVIYDIEQQSDHEDRYQVVRTLIPDPRVNGAGTPSKSIVLMGLVGPADSNGFHVFDYGITGGTLVAPGKKPFLNSVSLMQQVSSVLVNVDLVCSNSTKLGSNRDFANVGLRKQFFMRNRAAWMQ